MISPSLAAPHWRRGGAGPIDIPNPAGRPARRAIFLLLATLTWHAPARSLAQSVPELRNLGQQVAEEIVALKSSGRFDTAAQRAATERVGKGVLQYIELCDKAAASASEKRDGESLRRAYEALLQPLHAIHEATSGAMAKLERKIMEEDGDLEALYDTVDYKTARVTGSQALYYLNWLHYYGSRFQDGAKKKELLEQAQAGFAELSGGEKRTDLVVESQLGRGLCALELGDIDAAQQDLRAVMNDSQASPERRSKARLALLDGYVRGGRPADAVTLGEQLAKEATGAESNVVRYLRARALLDLAKKRSGAEAARDRQQAMSLMEQLRQAGGAWEERASALLASVDNPEQLAAGANSAVAKWQLARMLLQKGDMRQATPLLEAVANASEPELQRFRGEARYYLAVGKFQNGQLNEAVSLLNPSGLDSSAAYAADADYLRFKAMESLLAADANAVSPETYETAVRAFASHEDHKSAFEGAFRLGELLQRQRKFGDALEAYARVKGDPAFELRAEFASLQCRFELLETATASNPEARKQQIAEIGAALARFPDHAAAYEKLNLKDASVPLAQMRGKWAILRAAFETLQPQPSYTIVAEKLEGFEKSHPDLQDLFPQVTKLRLTADLHLARFDAAAREVRGNGALLKASMDAKSIEELASAFVRAGANRNAGDGGATYAAAEQVALALYELILADASTGVRTKLALAKLYENSGDMKKATALYEESLATNPTLVPALRGLARIAEREGHPGDALGRWETITKNARGGDLLWYEGKYEEARLTQALGKTSDACTRLTQLKPAMPGLTDADLRGRMNALYEQVCR